MVLPPSMGTAIVINFQPTGEGKAAITGDFVLLGSEVTSSCISGQTMTLTGSRQDCVPRWILRM